MRRLLPGCRGHGVCPAPSGTRWSWDPGSLHVEAGGSAAGDRPGRPHGSSPDLGACDFIILPTRAAEVSERAVLVGGGLCFHTWVILALRSLASPSLRGWKDQGTGNGSPGLSSEHPCRPVPGRPSAPCPCQGGGSLCWPAKDAAAVRLLLALAARPVGAERGGPAAPVGRRGRGQELTGSALRAPVQTGATAGGAV